MRPPETRIESNAKGSRDREFLRKLNALDFSPLAYRLISPENAPGMSMREATDAITKYKGFLFLYQACRGESISPSRYVDHVWHTHILDTELYMVQTTLLFGHYLHHFPFFGERDDADRGQLTVAADFTKAQAFHYFGWEDDDWCGTCEHQDRVLSREEIRILKLPFRTSVCKPGIDRLNKEILGIPAELLPEVSTLLVQERLAPKGFSLDLVSLKMQVEPPRN
jgi:hypothetical protein